MYLSNTQRIVAFPLQQCLCEGAAVLRSTYVACLGFFFFNIFIGMLHYIND
jgi:hypothetical protein